VDPREADPAVGSAERAALGIKSDAFVAVLIAALRPEKRVDVFFDAVTRARRRDPRITGVVAGDGPQLASLLQNAPAGMRLLGRHDDVAALIASADVVCLTSDAEALPMVILEAMAGARPVIATDVGGTRDAVVDSVTGYVVAPGDAGAFADCLVRLAADRELRVSLGAAGAKRQRDLFSTSLMVDRYEELLHEVVAA
jgi:glycosyltransferase involved in cell wall biosynthesis